MHTSGPGAAPPVGASDVFPETLRTAQEFADLLGVSGVERGLIGPREQAKLWERHILNSAVLGEVVPEGAHVVDVGSGAGLPGIPLRIARPDLNVTLVEPMARRVQWLEEVNDQLQLGITVVRARAEDASADPRCAEVDIVTARAVAPLARLMEWCLPLVRSGGTVLAIKGASAEAEASRDEARVHDAGGSPPKVVQCGGGSVHPPTTVVEVERLQSIRGGRNATARRGQRRRRHR